MKKELALTISALSLAFQQACNQLPLITSSRKSGGPDAQPTRPIPTPESLKAADFGPVIKPWLDFKDPKYPSGKFMPYNVMKEFSTDSGSHYRPILGKFKDGNKDLNAFWISRIEDGKPGELIFLVKDANFDTPEADVYFGLRIIDKNGKAYLERTEDWVLIILHGKDGRDSWGIKEGDKIARVDFGVSSEGEPQDLKEYADSPLSFPAGAFSLAGGVVAETETETPTSTMTIDSATGTITVEPTETPTPTPPDTEVPPTATRTALPTHTPAPRQPTGTPTSGAEETLPPPPPPANTPTYEFPTPTDAASNPEPAPVFGDRTEDGRNGRFNVKHDANAPIRPVYFGEPGKVGTWNFIAGALSFNVIINSANGGYSFNASANTSPDCVTDLALGTDHYGTFCGTFDLSTAVIKMIPHLVDKTWDESLIMVGPESVLSGWYALVIVDPGELQNWQPGQVLKVRELYIYQ